MNEDEITDFKHNIIESLKERYFLIPRNAWWAFLGGAVAFAVAVGFVSYQSALKALSDPVVEAAKQSIVGDKKTARESVIMIQRNLEASRTIEERIKALEIGIPPVQRAKIIADARAAEEAAARKKAASEPYRPDPSIKK